MQAIQVKIKLKLTLESTSLLAILGDEQLNYVFYEDSLIYNFYNWDNW